MPCYVYGKRVADDHWWARSRKKDPRWEHGEGPLCIRCGLPKGTWQSEEAYDRHRKRTGHGLGTGACVDECDPNMDKPWWEIEPENVDGSDS